MGVGVFGEIVAMDNAGNALWGGTTTNTTTWPYLGLQNPPNNGVPRFV
jgi:hypothetical protein